MLKKIWMLEPAAVVATVQAILALLVAFGLDLTAVQIGAILAVVAAVGGLITRSQVASVAALRSLMTGVPPGAEQPKLSNRGQSTIIIVLATLAIIALCIWIFSQVHVNN